MIAIAILVANIELAPPLSDAGFAAFGLTGQQTRAFASGQDRHDG
jgi:hypothetical protein